MQLPRRPDGHPPGLASEYGHDEVLELVASKSQAGEKEGAPVALSERLRSRRPELEARLDEALARSSLPETALNVDDINAWLIERRRVGFES